MRRLLMYAIPIVLGVGLLAAVANSPEPETSAASNVKQGGEVTSDTLPAVIESPPVTVPVTSPPAPAPEETTTSTTPPTTAPAPKATTTTRATPKQVAAPRPAPRPASTPPTTAAPAPPPVTVQPEPVDCGTGSASARSRLVLDAGTYKLVATVMNESTKDIQLDSLVVRAVYSSGTKTFNVNVGGRVVPAQPGPAEMSFDIPESAGPEAPKSFEIAEFRFHTAGYPECSSH